MSNSQQILLNQQTRLFTATLVLSSLDLSIGVASDNVTAGDTQTVTVTVSDQNSTQPIQNALVLANITDSSGTTLSNYTGTSDEVGQVSFLFEIPVDAASDVSASTCRHLLMDMKMLLPVQLLT